MQRRLNTPFGRVMKSKTIFQENKGPVPDPQADIPKRPLFHSNDAAQLAQGCIWPQFPSVRPIQTPTHGLISWPWPVLISRETSDAPPLPALFTGWGSGIGSLLLPCLSSKTCVTWRTKRKNKKSMEICRGMALLGLWRFGGTAQVATSFSSALEAIFWHRFW